MHYKMVFYIGIPILILKEGLELLTCSLQSTSAALPSIGSLFWTGLSSTFFLWLNFACHSSCVKSANLFTPRVKVCFPWAASSLCLAMYCKLSANAVSLCVCYNNENHIFDILCLEIYEYFFQDKIVILKLPLPHCDIFCCILI